MLCRILARRQRRGGWLVHHARGDSETARDGWLAHSRGVSPGRLLRGAVSARSGSEGGVLVADRAQRLQ